MASNRVVSSFNGRTDTVVLTTPDIVAAAGIVTINGVAPNAAGNVTVSATGAQVQADWNQIFALSPAYILNKPIITTPIQSDWNVVDPTNLSFIQNKPIIPDQQQQSDWYENATNRASFIRNKPVLSKVATSGLFSDLNGVPAGFIQQQSDFSQTDPTQPNYVKNKPNYNQLATISKNENTLTQNMFPYTIQATDNGATIVLNSAISGNIIVPSGLGEGFNCNFIQIGIGQITFTAATGVTLASLGSLIHITALYSKASLEEVAADFAILSGNIS